MKMENIKYMCPDCMKQTEFMSEYHQGDSYIAIFHCEECNTGTDKDWEVTYEGEKIKQIQRYYFG